MNEAPAARRLYALGAIINGRGAKTAANAASLEAQSSTSAPIQLVKVGETNITKDTPRSAIIEALSWSKLTGFGIHLELETFRELEAALKEKPDCSDILEDVKDKIEDLEQADEEDDDHDFDDESNTGESEQRLGELVDPHLEEAEERKRTAEAFGWENYPAKVGNYVKIGVHETHPDKVLSLTTTGPDPARFGTGSSSGKGAGFYVTHVGNKTLYSAVKDVTYAHAFVAIYVSDKVEKIKSDSDEMNNIVLLDKQHGGKLCYYVMSGGAEIVVPERSLAYVKPVSKPEQLEALK